MNKQEYSKRLNFNVSIIVIKETQRMEACVFDSEAGVAVYV